MSTQAAYEINGALVTQPYFYAVACDPRRSVAVEACAGSGKTWMLVSRMVRALLEGCAPQDILAITFTKKAAGEMRQRLQQWLAEFARADDDTLREALRVRGLTQTASDAQLQTLRGLHAALLRQGRPVQIRTFHSWFAALLRTAPMAVLHGLGLPAQYELLESDDQAVAQVWRRFQTRVAGDAPARADYMAAVATYGRHQAHKALEAALSKRVEFGLADAHGVVDTSIDHFAQQFPEFGSLAHPLEHLQTPAVQQLLQDAAHTLGASPLVTCTTAASVLERALTDGDMPGAMDALLTKTGTARKFSDKLAGIACVREAQDVLLRLGQAQHQHEAWLHQQRMARLARGLLEDYAALKRERGWIDMGDLERAALALMSDPVLSGWVQERLDARVRHVLIDEFQDTNPLQWQALSAWLSGYAGAGQAPGVFIVGDPKQSIYRFRRAEPQVFMAAKEFVVQGLGGDVLSCDHTRRNAQGITALVNTAMGAARDAGAYDGFREHSTDSTLAGQVLKLPRLLRATADAGLADPASGGVAPASLWRDSLTTPRHTAEDTLRTLECRQAAQWVAALLADPASGHAAKDIMVLARRRQRLGLMQAELARLHVPAQQPEKADLADMPEVQDLVALLDVLVSNAHDLSLARALKSPLFAASDDDLVQLVLRKRAMEQANEKAGGAVSWWQVLQDGQGIAPALQAAGLTLARWKQWLSVMPPHDALSAIYDDADVLRRFAAATPATLRRGVLANLRALLHAAMSVNGGRYTTAYALVRALLAGGMAAPVSPDDKGVRLLTVHGAKGLEAPVVLLLDTDGESPKAETMGVLVDWPGEDAYPRRFAFLASESRPPACAAHALQAEQQARRREELNGLYVAITRTRQTLVLSSVEPHGKTAGSWWERLAAHAAAAIVPSEVAAVPGAEAPEGSFSLKILQKLPLAPVQYAQAAIETIANPDSAEARIGQAMHRLLEWVVPEDGGVRQAPWTVQHFAQVRADFGLDVGQLQGATAMALAILQGDGAWAWDSRQLLWHANEVPLTQRGRLLRIDRLVHRAGTAEPAAWWVLDYKSAAQPQNQPDLVAQLTGYRNAIVKAQPGQPVRAAFLTAPGALIEIPFP